MFTCVTPAWDLSRVDLIEARSGQIMCAVRPLDKAANAQGLRRPLEHTTNTTAPAMPDTGIAPLLKQMIADYAATGLNSSGQQATRVRLQ